MAKKGTNYSIFPILQSSKLEMSFFMNTYFLILLLDSLPIFPPPSNFVDTEVVSTSPSPSVYSFSFPPLSSPVVKLTNVKCLLSPAAQN